MITLRKIFELGIVLIVLFLSPISCIFIDVSAVQNVAISQRSLENSPHQLNLTYKPHVVVAMIDSGVNIYHEVFQKPNLTQHPSTYIEGFPSDVESVNLTFGDNYSSNYEYDKDIWEHQLKQRTLYWFPHTNIIGISFGNSTFYSQEDLGYSIIDIAGHGTETTSVIEKINPNVTIVVVQVGANKVNEALSWAVNQSWIDIIDIEFGVWYKPRVLIPTTIWWTGAQAITKRGVEQGKIIVTATGNKPWINPTLSFLSGPPWVISVGGAEGYCHGVSITATKDADYVSSFTQIAAVINSTSKYYPASGTSLSIPTVVGTISSIIFKVREELNYTHGILNKTLVDIPEKGIHITNSDIRNALNYTAVYWKTTDWSFRDWITKSPWKNVVDPFTDEPLPLFIRILMRKAIRTLPVNPVAPWLQMGWGFIDASIVNDSVDVLADRKPMPEKPDGAVRYMENIYRIREKIWGG
ncbi:MAG: S8/S53 family peptidase [Euryarchaeota archaeon]|nr:S8/S53 family peptidase [Euryarchaeota archaeon]